MANLTAGYTIVEMAKNIAPDGSQMHIAKTMAIEIAMLQDIVWFPSNDTWAHKSTQQSKLSAGTWRGVNEYVTPGIVLTRDQSDVIGMIDDFAIYDKKWIDRQPDPRMARLGRSTMYLQGIAESIATAFLYGNNAITPKKPHGLAPRLNDTDQRYVISNGGSSNLTSIYVVNWGMNQVFGVYPKNGQPPEGDFLVKQTDMTGPEGRIDTVSSQKMVVYEDHFEFEGGLVVEDPRCLGRVCNIDYTTASTSTFENDLITLMDLLKTGPGTCIYMNESIISSARIRMKDKGNVHWGPGVGEGLFGKSVLSFDGIPIKKIDSKILLNSETQVTS